MSEELDPSPVLAALAGDPQLRAYVRNGAIAVLPGKLSRRRLLLQAIVGGFEPGVRYPEQDVSQFLGALHPDYAALRRYMVDEGLLSRADGLYWRSGN
ncbi:MAG TPA: DUF2087 domain-containing protein [Streptosporangiaceae bacterium]|nr:DUF2087 domain-containing protein [Streptosporangiaceae bacterium]